jgi:hypothetical protein
MREKGLFTNPSMINDEKFTLPRNEKEMPFSESLLNFSMVGILRKFRLFVNNFIGSKSNGRWAIG